MNQYFDSTLLKPESTAEQIAALCLEAKEYNFKAVCVNPCYVELAKDLLEGSDVSIATVIGFPLGASTTDAKTQEAIDAISKGAKEVDMVMNVGFLKSGRYNEVKEDIACVVAAARDLDAIVKVILETCLLTDEEIVRACDLAVEAGAAFVKTSTGFSTGGATVEAVKLMRETVGDRCQVKASGGIRDLKTAQAMIDAGADRLGCSACAKIMNELNQ